MTDREIREAFERMGPDEAAKRRMLEKIQASAPEQKPKRRSRKGIFLLAAAVAAGLSVMAAAYGTDFFGLWSAGMPNREIYSPVEIEEGVFVPGTRVVDEISLQGLRDSPEYQAGREWEDFADGYDPDGIILKTAGEYFGTPPEYDAYFCYSQEMQDKLDELCEKYDLRLLGPRMDGFTAGELFAAVGTGNVCNGDREMGTNQFDWGYYYAGGAYFFEGAFSWTDGRTTDYQFNCSAKGCLGTMSLNVEDLDDYEQWEYTTADGVPLLLALGPIKGLIIADTEESFVVVNVLGDWFNDGGFNLGREDMEQLAEAFDFTTIP